MTQDLSTRLVHHPYQPPAGFAAPQPGVHKASTIIFPNVAALQCAQLAAARRLHLRSARHAHEFPARGAHRRAGRRHACVLVPSGLAAIALVDHQRCWRRATRCCCPPTSTARAVSWPRQELARWGITHRLYDPMDAASLAAMIGPQTKLVWLEAPGSVTMEFPDLTGLVKAAQARGVLTALDNTWGAGVALRGFDHGIDIVMQALTKYASGGGDVLMGSVVTRDRHAARAHQVRAHAPGPVAWAAATTAKLVLRSTGDARRCVTQAQDAGRPRAGPAWLAYAARGGAGAAPGLGRQHRAIEYWQSALHRRRPGLFSRDASIARFSAAQVDAFVDALKPLQASVISWAGPVSLVVPYDVSRPCAAPRRRSGLI